MNSWKDDTTRNRMHRRSAQRRWRATLGTLLAVAGWLTVLLAGFLATMALLKQFQTRARLFELSRLYAAAGLGLVAVHLLFCVLPKRLEHGRSAAHQRRSRENGARRRIAPSPAARRDGMALVLVLVALALISALVVQAHLAARALARGTELHLSQGRLAQAATDAARAALQRLADDPDLLADTTNEAWAAAEDRVRPDGIATRVRVRDENSRFDLNNLAAPGSPPGRRAPDVLFDVFALCGNFDSSTHLAALEDWADADRDGLYEDIAYLKLQPAYRSPNRLLFTWEESLHAAGGSRERYRPHGRQSTRDVFAASLPDCLTVIPVPRVRPVPVNVNTASADVLQGVLGLGQDALVRTILTLRAIRPIQSFDALGVTAEPGVMERLRPYMDVRSHFFRIEAQAAAEGRHAVLSVVARRDPAGRVDVLQWVF